MALGPVSAGDQRDLVDTSLALTFSVVNGVMYALGDNSGRN